MLVLFRRCFRYDGLRPSQTSSCWMYLTQKEARFRRLLSSREENRAYGPRERRSTSCCLLSSTSSRLRDLHFLPAFSSHFNRPCESFSFSSLFSLGNLRPAYLLEYPSRIGKTARLFKILQDRPMIFTFPFVVFKSFIRFTWPAEACCCQNSQQKWLMRLHENRQRVRRVRDVTFGSV